MLCYGCAQVYKFSLYVKKFLVKADDLIPLKERGRGAYGVVYEMKHQETGTIMAVKVLTLLYNAISVFHICVLLTIVEVILMSIKNLSNISYLKSI